MGLGFRAEFLGPAPDVLVPPGLEIGGISFASGILGAVVLGGGLLVLTTVYELVRRKEAFGGGDIKLMAVLGFVSRVGALGLFACMNGVCAQCRLCVWPRDWPPSDGARRHDRNTGASGSADHAGTGVPSVSEPILSGAIREVATEHDRDSLLAGTMPFAPFTPRTLVAFVA